MPWKWLPDKPFNQVIKKAWKQKYSWEWDGEKKIGYFNFGEKVPFTFLEIGIHKYNWCTYGWLKEKKLFFLSVCNVEIGFYMADRTCEYLDLDLLNIAIQLRRPILETLDSSHSQSDLLIFLGNQHHNMSIEHSFILAHKSPLINLTLSHSLST